MDMYISSTFNICLMKIDEILRKPFDLTDGSIEKFGIDELV